MDVVMIADNNYLSVIKPNRKKALMLACREVSVLVHDSVLLEGINFTLPEISTLLEGVTVGGHKLSDQQIALNQGLAWRYLFKSIEDGFFALDMAFVCQLHALVAKEEALEWGRFRSGMVTIAGSAYMPPVVKALPDTFCALVKSAEQISAVYDRAIHVFLVMARSQFFYDGNKRTGRLMMNGILLNAGYPVLNLPAKHQLEFNELMMGFYDSGNESAMNAFMRRCIDPRIVEIMSE